MRWELSDGTALGAHPGFVRMMLNAALHTLGHDAAVIEEFASGKSLDDQLQEMRDLMRTNPREYDKPENEAKRNSLYAKVAEREASDANRAA
jgi:hypothetical protein